MHILAVILILIYAGAVAGPVTGVAIIYSDNPVEVILPPEVEQVVDTVINPEKPIEPPQYVSSSYDPTTRTVTATFSFTNPFNVDLRVNSLSADVECADHQIALGHAQLSHPVGIDEGTTARITVDFVWTDAAEVHFRGSHGQESSVDINLINLGVDVSGITIETPESLMVNVPLLG